MEEKKGLEIRWHGRGGQGAKTAALLLADVAFKTGQYVDMALHYARMESMCRVSRNMVRSAWVRRSLLTIELAKTRFGFIPIYMHRTMWLW